MSGLGSSTAALGIGGFNPSNTSGINSNENWNGTSWTELNNLNTARYGSGSAGISTNAMTYGGYGSPNYLGVSEDWDGNVWTEVNDLNTSRNDLIGAGASYTAGLAIGGNAPPYTGATELWSSTSDTIKVLTD
jgi:hypothetical protein